MKPVCFNSAPTKGEMIKHLYYVINLDGICHSYNVTCNYCPFDEEGNCKTKNRTLRARHLLSKYSSDEILEALL